MKRIILDTDVGTDVDDALALALAAASPELRIEGVTTGLPIRCLDYYRSLTRRPRVAKCGAAYGTIQVR